MVFVIPRNGSGPVEPGGNGHTSEELVAEVERAVLKEINRIVRHTLAEQAGLVQIASTLQANSSVSAEIPAAGAGEQGEPLREAPPAAEAQGSSTEELLTGVVRLTVVTAHQMRPAVNFLYQIRKKVNLRLMQTDGSPLDESFSIMLALREPLPLRSVLARMDGVREIRCSDSRDDVSIEVWLVDRENEQSTEPADPGESASAISSEPIAA